MINVVVWTHDSIEIENKLYSIQNQDNVVMFLKELLDKVHYSGEAVCLETATISDGRANFVEIERWK